LRCIVADPSSAIYVQTGKDLWRLMCVANMEASDRAGHSWPKTATGGTVARWKTNCTWERVAYFGTVMLEG
jgi:hypothetical protein